MSLERAPGSPAAHASFADGSAPLEHGREAFDPRCCIPLLLTQAACLAVFWVGVSPAAIAACVITYVVRAFGITAGYHRLLSHHAYETGRGLQFFLAFLGCAAAQLGPLWWVAHHHVHHPEADAEGDVHSPRHAGGGMRGFWWAHMGWLLCRRHSEPDYSRVGGLARFPELVWLDLYHWVAPAATIVVLFLVGEATAGLWPASGTNGLQFVVWGFFVATTALYHATFAVNSFGHTVGTQPFAIDDDSRNHPWLAFATLGEGWHNNHHHDPGSARIGMRPGEFDPGYRVLELLAKLGWVRNLRPPRDPAASA